MNNTQIGNAKNLAVFIWIYNLIEYSDNYSKTTGSLWQYYRDEPAFTDAGIINYSGNSTSFNILI